MDIVKYLRSMVETADTEEDDLMMRIGIGRVTQAADEIEKLREALRSIAYDSFDLDERATFKRIARAALDEDE